MNASAGVSPFAVPSAVTTRAPDCATADALSTAFSVMTPAESVALADSLGDVGCLLVEADGTSTTNESWNDRAIAARPDTTRQGI